MRRATSCTSIGRPKRLYFYPRSPCGGRLIREPTAGRDNKFLSTLSLRRATYTIPETLVPRQFLSTLSLRRATGLSYFYIIKITISIHALLAESDRPHGQKHINSRTFLSTLSLRRATSEWWSQDLQTNYFYPRSPCGERHAKYHQILHPHNISIHALLAESDPVSELRVTSNVHFYPRSPCGERPEAIKPS